MIAHILAEKPIDKTILSKYKYATGKLSNPNWDWAVKIALEESTTAEEFLSVIRSDLTGKRRDYKGDLIPEGRYDYRDIRHSNGMVGRGINSFIDLYNQTAEQIGKPRIEADYPESELFSVYLNIRNPLDMDKKMTKDDMDKFLGAFGEKNVYLDDIISGSGEFQRITGKDYAGLAKDFSFETIKKLKKSMYDQTHSTDHPDGRWVKGDPAFPVLHLSGRDDLTWGDYQYIITNGQNRNDANRFNDAARSLGYDGMSHTGGWNVGSKPHKVWIAFEPNQIKATANKGTFSVSDKNIYKSYRSVKAITHAGLALLAKDTGRVLMLQRAITEDDPAAGMWEFPGGGIEGDESPFEAACREWQEEVGQKLPKGLKQESEWFSGCYVGCVACVDSEDEIPINSDKRKVRNPDDPDGDWVEVVAWWNPQMIEGNPACREELIDSYISCAAAISLATECESPLTWFDGDIVKEWNPDLHPRGRDGRFINKDEMMAATFDPIKAAKLLAEVKDEDAMKQLAIELKRLGMSSPDLKTALMWGAKYRAIYTPEFKNWFGDWEEDIANSSKVLDAHGMPDLAKQSDDLGMPVVCVPWYSIRRVRRV